MWLCPSVSAMTINYENRTESPSNTTQRPADNWGRAMYKTKTKGAAIVPAFMKLKFRFTVVQASMLLPTGLGYVLPLIRAFPNVCTSTSTPSDYLSSMSTDKFVWQLLVELPKRVNYWGLMLERPVGPCTSAMRITIAARDFGEWEGRRVTVLTQSKFTITPKM